MVSFFQDWIGSIKFMNNIVVFATDDVGGAGKAALRIVKAFNRSGRNCKMLVKNKTSVDNDVIKIQPISKFPFEQRVLRYFANLRKRGVRLNDKYFFGGRYDDIYYMDIDKYINFVPDTIIVTWITWFVSPKTIKLFADKCGAKIVICPLDMSPFTGGCHYAWNCNGFESNCKHCPAIIDEKYKYIAVNILKEKREYWSDNIARFWSCSSGLSSELNRASIVQNKRVENLLIPIDENIFNANNRINAKNVFGIDSSDKVILFGSTFSYEERKGINFFLESIEVLHNMLSVSQKQNIKIVIAGRKIQEKFKYRLPFDIIDIDFIKDDLLLSQLYQASDVLVCPSIQDSGPMMINEAQMCGLPVVAFKVGVIPDFIINDFSGYTCDIGNVEQMAIGIKKIVFNEICLDNMEIANVAFDKTSFNSFNRFINS